MRHRRKERHPLLELRQLEALGLSLVQYWGRSANAEDVSERFVARTYSRHACTLCLRVSSAAEL